jgi:predicted negative regulator of RcsB-dependent stress response
MATHIHEQEQVEALKRWWKENGASVIAGLVVGLIGIVAWNRWETYQTSKALEASSLYLKLENAVAEGKYDLASNIARRLSLDFDSTSYADFARLMMAKAEIEQGHLEAAKPWLEGLIQSSKDENFRHIARLRLARLLLALGKPSEGISLLMQAENPGQFSGEYEEVKGDLYRAWGKTEEAKDAYRKAISLGRNYFYLKMKLDDLDASSS